MAEAINAANLLITIQDDRVNLKPPFDGFFVTMVTPGEDKEILSFETEKGGDQKRFFLTCDDIFGENMQ